MSLHFVTRLSFRRLFAIIPILFLAVTAVSAKSAEAQGTPSPRLQLFGGYSYLYPNSTASGVLPGGVLPVSSCLCGDKKGFGVGAAVGLTPWLAIAVDGSRSFSGGGSTPATQVGQWSFYNISAGPSVSLPGHRFTPFGETLVGVNNLNPALFPPGKSSFGVIAGGGLDMRISHHFGVRLARADYVFSNNNYGNAPNNVTSSLRGLRLQAGILISFGSIGHPKIAPQPLPVPIAAPIIAAPVVAAPLPEQTTLALVARPANVLAGENATIAATGFSLQNRPLTYSYQASAGVIQGTGASALLSTAGLAAGAVLVTGTVVDNLGATATANTTVMVTMATPIVRMPEAIGTVLFTRDLRRPVRVDNEAKALLDGVALDLQRNSDYTLVLVGAGTVSEPNRRQRAAQRAIDTKAYLVHDKGIDASRISLYTGPADTKAVTITKLPPGATMDTTGLTPVDKHTQVQP